MQVVSVNVGKARRLEGRSFKGQTGIIKEPVSGSVSIGELGLSGDAIINGKYHGGPDQAVYLYRSEDYAWWSEELGREIGPGTFGENLTVSGLPAPGIAVGTRLNFESLRLEVTAPRIPCNTLAQRMDDPKFAKAFIRAERPGIYCRVLTPGSIETDATFSLDASAASGVSTLDMFRGAYRKLDRDALERFLAAPIDVRSRTDYEEQLARL
ncbi:MAG: MOSC domain-containing protein [Pseudomonadota bacterium]